MEAVLEKTLSTGIPIIVEERAVLLPATLPSMVPAAAVHVGQASEEVGGDAWPGLAEL